MNISDKWRTIRYTLIFVVAAAVLVIGLSPGTSHADLLSGADTATLAREAQKTPDGLGFSNLVGLQFADPAAQIDLVQPPIANNHGDAQISHALSMPPGRGGVQPDLALTYSSRGDNGWTGFGWDLSVGEVTIDTRWGVPRYDSAKETETYTLDGKTLSPTAVRSTLLDRQADREFKRRVEGKFERIIRHGTGPGSYWWEIADKSGTNRYYGGTPEGGRDAAAILSDDSGNGFSWALKQVRDISKNTMTFNYSKVTGAGVGSSNAAIGRELYLSSILYTGTVATGLTNDPAYEVRFIRDSQLGESRRPDVSVDGRGGFLRVTSDLLRHVEVYHRDILARRFILNYSEGAFRKTLLDNVVQTGSDGIRYARHTFDYFDDVRSGTTYVGFATESTWNTQDDDIKYNIPLVDGNENASALSGTESQGGDGRAYLGFNPWSSKKTGSFGGALALGGQDGFSRLEFIDINGDNLPDKVFEEDGDVKYRLNTSGPNGGTTFGSKQSVTGIDNLSRESSFTFGIGPEAYFGVSVMYNHAWSWSWGKEYFIDVNTDGLPDFVDNGTVYFNSLDGSGSPVFTTDSSGTAVPIDSGAVDPNVLSGFDDIEAEQRAESPLQDTVRRWRAPFAGEISITGDVQLLPPVADGITSDGVRVAIQKEGAELWNMTIAGTDYNAHSPSGVDSVTVSRGDDIYFRLQSIDDGASDEVSWDPLITYTGVSSTVDVNGLDIYSYQASEDFTLGGRTDITSIAPLDGTVRVTGDFEKLRKTTDDITVEIIKNGVAVIPSTTIGRNSTGTTPIAMDFSVTSQDEIQLRLKIDSPVDLSAFSWLPRLYYLYATDSDGEPVVVVDDNGDPTLDLNAPVDIQMYPGNDLTGPQATWTALISGSIKIDVIPYLQFSSTTEDGTISVSVKKKITPAAAGDPPAELVGKQTLTVVNGVVTNADPAIFTVTFEENVEYWFDLSMSQPRLAEAWGPINPTPPPPTPPLTYPITRHWSYIPETVFPMAFRSWGIAGYNGDGELATSPIVEANLIFDENDYPHSKPAVDPNIEYPTSDDVDPNYQNPVQGKSFIYAPFVKLDEETDAVVALKWVGTKENLFGSGGGAGSSRVGPDSIGLPGSNDILGARAVTRFSLTEADAIAGGIGGLVGGSYAWGTSEGILDFFDMNGDQFPDILGDGGVQYTTVRGGMDDNSTPLSQLSDNVREDSTTSKTLDGGGAAVEIKADSKGESNTSQDVRSASGQNRRSGSGKGNNGSAKSGEDSQTGVSLGLSGGLGWSSTNTDDDSPLDDLLESDLADINGDGLPDRVKIYKDGSISVFFNLGYAFDSNEIAWAGSSFESGKSFSFSVGPTLGFSTGNLAFGGGVSVASSSEESRSSWADLNGDGLVDQLRRTDGDQVLVRFGTGAGLTSDVDFGNFRADKIATSRNSSLGGGIDFTIGVGPLCLVGCYVIVNPGGHYEGGMSRQELELHDVNGDGYPDHVGSTDDNEMHVRLNNTGRTNLLKSVDNPLGGTINIDYTRMGNTITQPYSQWVMSRVAVDDGRPGDGPDVRLSTYEYAGNIFNALERDFLGYSTVTERQRDTSAGGEPVLRSFEREYRNGTIFENGLQIRETLFNASGVPLKETVNDWQFVDVDTGGIANLDPDPAGVGLLGLTVFPQMVRTESRWYTDGVETKSTWNSFTYDQLGNIIQTVDIGEPLLANDDVIATTTYTDCTASTWVSLPDTFEIEDGSGNILRSRRAELLCGNGAVTKLWEDTGSGEALTELKFNAWGSYNHITYPPNADGERYEVIYTYDDDRRTNIAQVEDSYGLVGEATYHGPTGQIVSQTDANGQVTTYAYDTAGRLASITRPYEQRTGHASVTFEYFPMAHNYAYGLAHHFDAFNPADTIDTVSFLDGIGRKTQTKQDATLFRGVDQSDENVMIYIPTALNYACGLTHLCDTSNPADTTDTASFLDEIGRKTQTKQDATLFQEVDRAAEDVMIVAGAVEFDALGRVIKEWYPIEEPLGTIGTYNINVDSVNPKETEWDPRDRVTKITAPNGATIATSYGVDDGTLFGATMSLATRTDPLGNVRRSYHDVHNNVLAVSVDHDSDRLLTTYEYDPMLKLTRTIDSHGNETMHEYDLMGRRTATTTPDGGRVELEYDLASHVIAKVTPNLRASGGMISYSYDFDHLVGISYTDGTPDVIYEYGADGAANNGAGRIVRVVDGARDQTRKFGRLGEVVEETTTMLVHNIDDNTEERLTWKTSAEFDTWGRRKQMTYPDGEVVSYNYDSGGHLNFMIGDKAGTPYPYLNRQEYDKFLARRFQESGNGVVTETRYNDETRRMERQIIEAPGRRVQDLNYTYDDIGNVLALENAAPTPVTDLMGGTSQQTFEYDDIYRLASAEGTYHFAPGKRREYTYDLTYDNLGNILQKTQTDTIFEGPNNNGVPQGKTTYDFLYDYNAAPHQPTHIGTQTYSYDANGNLTGWTDDSSGQNRTVTWDAEDRVTSVADEGATTRYTYDDEDRLAIERGPQGETSFVNRFYTIHNGTVAWKHFWAGTERVATKRQMPENEFEQFLYFLHKDLLGSTILVTDPNAKIFQYLQYFPGGETWVLEHSDIYRVPYLFSGGYYDESHNLYNFGARWYEPREQFFYSTDPLLNQSPRAPISDPALLAAYTYAEDNPVRLVDRDGRAPESAQRAFRSSFTRPDGSLDMAKVRAFNALVQQKSEKLLPGRTGRLVAKIAANPKSSAKTAFKAFAEFSASPVVQINLKRTPDGLKLKNIKVAPFFFKQFTVKKGKAATK